MHLTGAPFEEDAVEVGLFGAGPVVVSCEHASERLPAGWTWPARDQRLVGTHWAYDLGAREVAFELAREIGATVVASRFSRLLVDPNRPLHSETLFRTVCDGVSVELNRDLSAADREQRLERCYRPFHAALDRVLGRNPQAHTLFSIHSFTPCYEGQVRRMEVGVLFDQEEALAQRVLEAVRSAGFMAEPNEPWSGKGGLMYAADSHSAAHGKRALELEVRQDLAVRPEIRQRLVPVLVEVLSERA